MNYKHLAVVLAVAAPILGSVRAAQNAIAFDTSRFWNMGTGPGVFGWQFSTRSDIQISALGLYDNPGVYNGDFVGDGFLNPHAIGIWDVSNPSNALVSSVIPAGTLAPMLNAFRYVSISPVVLPAGRDYVIGVLYPNADWRTSDYLTGEGNNPTFVLTVSPEIEFGGRRYGGLTSSILVFPERYTPGQLESFGPNFTYSVIPEPSALTLFVLGAMPLFTLVNALRPRPGPVRASVGKSW